METQPLEGSSLIDVIPEELRNLHQWVVWKNESDENGKSTKVPYNPSDYRASTKKPEHWRPFVSAYINRKKFDGIGFILSESDQYVGVDLDGCINESGKLADWASEIIERLKGVAYGEVSPSGRGIKFITQAKKPQGKCVKKLPGGSGKHQIECYEKRRFWTMTGRVFSADHREIGNGQEAISWLVEKYLKSTRPIAAPAPIPNRPPDRAVLIGRASKYLAKMDPSIQGQGGSVACMKAALAMAKGFCLSRTDAIDLLLYEYNQRCDPPWSEEEIVHKVDDAIASTELNEGYLLTADPVNQITDMSFGPGKPAEWIDEAEDDPQRLARVNLKVYEEGHSGRLIYWRDEWWKWKAGKYRRIETSELRAKVWAAVRNEFERCWKDRKKTGDDKPVKKVTNALISNVIGAMESICCIPSSVPMPCWMPDRSQPHYVSTINGILNLDAVFGKRPVSEWMTDHSPDWFSAFRLDYPFDPDAECPKWIDYISYSMDGDEERIAILQEWAGYLLTGSNDLQKFLVLEGEGSNGKTVFFSGMTAMLGEDNVSHVSIENFGGRFELGTTIGKSANISGDAGEIEGIAEGVLKQFTGGDIMQFDRKNLSPISARPTAKLMAAWNGRPRIKDKSMGLWRRMLLVPFNRKVEDGRKVYGMDKPEWWIKQKEAPGILLWAIAGLYRLRQQGGFTRSKVADDAIYEYREESNPAMRFLHERVSFLPKEILDREVEKDYSEQRGVKADDLYLRYKEWCKDESVTPLAKQNFGKQIARQFGNLKHRRGARGDRYFVYRLLTIEEDF